jgi:PAS domain S-box-containing protein
MGSTPATRRWLLVALAAQLVIAVVDATVSERAILTGVFALAPFALAVVAPAGEVAIVAAVGTLLVLASGWWNDYAWSTEHLMRVLVVGAGGALAVAAASAREAAVGLAQRTERLAGELIATRDRLDGILSSLGEAVTVHDEQGKTVYANEAAARLLGCESVEEVLAARPGELAERFLITHEDGSPVRLAEFPGRRLVAGEEGPPTLVTRTVRRDTGEAFWLLTKATLRRDADGSAHAINIIEDITEAKEAELRQRYLAESGQLLASSLDPAQTLERVAGMAVPWLADWCAVDVVDEYGERQSVALAHVDESKLELARALRDNYPPDEDAPSGVPAILRGGPAELYREIPEELLEAAAQDEEHLRLIRSVGLRSAMAVPMRIGAETLGVITFATAESGRTYDDADFAFAQDLALRAATALQNARLYAAQMRVAHTLQASLLPERLPDVPGWEAHASYHAGERGADVGGDFYDLLPVAGGHLLIVGDVTGKGVEAAALTALVRHSTRMAARFNPRPTRVLALVNQVLREQARLAPVTAACAHIDTEGGEARIVLASAGHPLPLLKPAEGGPAQTLGVHGVLLGVVGDEQWPETIVELSLGDTVLFYTDGVTDTPGEAERFGEPRLRDAVGRAPADPARLLAALERDLSEFQAGEILDDRAMLALRFVGQTGSAGVLRAA